MWTSLTVLWTGLFSTLLPLSICFYLLSFPTLFFCIYSPVTSNWYVIDLGFCVFLTHLVIKTESSDKLENTMKYTISDSYTLNNSYLIIVLGNQCKENLHLLPLLCKGRVAYLPELGACCNSLGKATSPPDRSCLMTFCTLLNHHEQSLIWKVRNSIF